MWQPDSFKLFHGKTGSFSLTDSFGQTLNVGLEPAAEVMIQDSRKWSPNLHVHVMIRPGGSATGAVQQQLRLSMANVAGEGAVKKTSDDDVWGRRGTHGERPLRMPIPPWPSQYKLKPEDRDKLTAADVVGPDGVVYPNWTQVGVQGGIPDVPVALKLADRGAEPGTDIAAELARACAEVGDRGGGAILIGPGTFYLDQPVEVRQNGVVIRGSGRDATRLIFRYSLVATNPLPPYRNYIPYGAITFLGAKGERQYRLAADARRGDTALALAEDSAGLKPGDKVLLLAWGFPAAALSRCPEGWVRHNKFAVSAVAGRTLTLGQPLRIDYPRRESLAQTLLPVERCGVEDLTLEHTCKLRYDSVGSHLAWNCWARRLKIVRTGRSGVHFEMAKWCEVRDCEFDGSHDTGGGSAYGGFTWSQDCLMENCTFRHYRHGPCVQFAAQGNVIRNCAFDGSDAQWHAGWSTENLFENCVIDSRQPLTDPPDERGGGYGFGMYATGSSDATHGPNGPRNVVYNCDVTSPFDGVWGRGASENWLFLHNRFTVGAGPGFAADGGFFDAILRHNTFILHDPKWPMVLLETADCTGFEAIDNTLYGGSGKLIEGATAPAVDRANRALPAVSTNRAAADFPPRPRPDPPSIYEWQQRHAKR